MKEPAYYQMPQNFVIFQPQSLYLSRLKQGYYCLLYTSHGALAQSLSVLAAMIVAIRGFVLLILAVCQRPAAVRTLYQP